MKANWNLILNVLLLVGVVITIGRVMKARRRSFSPVIHQPALEPVDNKAFDDIIAVRKINIDLPDEFEEEIALSPQKTRIKEYTPVDSAQETSSTAETISLEPGKSVMMFLSAKENRLLAGYELLQTVLASGLRFGDGNLFHRHQHSNGQGPVICSLAAATATGIFDLQNIGAFSARGLCLFMQASGNSTIDAERFNIMYETAKQLRDGLDANLLDGQQRPLTDKSISFYHQQLNIRQDTEVHAEELA